MMRESMSRLTPQFSANRTVREYVEHYYVPAANHYGRRLGNGAGKEIKRWRESLGPEIGIRSNLESCR